MCEVCYYDTPRCDLCKVWVITACSYMYSIKKKKVSPLSLFTALVAYITTLSA